MSGFAGTDEDEFYKVAVKKTARGFAAVNGARAKFKIGGKMDNRWWKTGPVLIPKEHFAGEPDGFAAALRWCDAFAEDIYREHVLQICGSWNLPESYRAKEMSVVFLDGSPQKTARLLESCPSADASPCYIEINENADLDDYLFEEIDADSIVDTYLPSWEIFDYPLFMTKDGGKPCFFVANDYVHRIDLTAFEKKIMRQRSEAEVWHAGVGVGCTILNDDDDERFYRIAISKHETESDPYCSYSAEMVRSDAPQHEHCIRSNVWEVLFPKDAFGGGKNELSAAIKYCVEKCPDIEYSRAVIMGADFPHYIGEEKELVLCLGRGKNDKRRVVVRRESALAYGFKGTHDPIVLSVPSKAGRGLRDLYISAADISQGVSFAEFVPTIAGTKRASKAPRCPHDGYEYPEYIGIGDDAWILNPHIRLVVEP